MLKQIGMYRQQREKDLCQSVLAAESIPFCTLVYIVAYTGKGK
jgi:hypothetical protein